MSWNLTKSELCAIMLPADTDFQIEFKETHLGPLKNSLGGRSTSTSTIKADSVEPMEEKLSTTSSNDIGEAYVLSGSTCAYCC